MRRNRRKCVLGYLAALAAESTPDPPTYDVDPDHEMSGFIHFKSEEEVKDLERGIRRRVRRSAVRPTLPRSPDVPEEEFESIQKRVTRKTAGETLQEYCTGAKARHAIPEEVLEATAEDLQSEDELDDADNDADSRSESEEELPARIELSDDCGRISRIDFVPIINDENAASLNFNKSAVDDFTLQPRIESSAMQAGSSGMDFEPADAGVSSTRQFLYDEEDSLISGFHPKSCSTSIGHGSLDQSRFMDFEDIPETSPGIPERPCDRTIVPYADSPSSSSSNSTLKSFDSSPEVPPPERCKSPEVSPSRIITGRISLDRTPTTMMRQCNLGSSKWTESSYSCPERRRSETPIAKRLRRLGLIDSSRSASLHTPKRRKLATARRCVQVYGTPQRNPESLEHFFRPTVDLAELVKFRVVERDPLRINFSLKPARLEDRF